MSFSFGTFGLVILVALGLMAVVACGVFAIRFLEVRQALADRVDLLSGVEQLLKAGRFDEARSVCVETQTALSRVVAVAAAHATVPEAARQASVASTIRAEESAMMRHIASLDILARLAPLVGLLGTIGGFIATVMALNVEGLVSRADLMGGMMQALVCAGAGLAVAIPVHVMYAYLKVRVDRVSSEMSAVGDDVLACLTEANAKGAARA